MIIIFVIIGYIFFLMLSVTVSLILAVFKILK